MSNTQIYVDTHILQTVPPSCVNRDDTGSPKTAVYGGATRARVSSQAWKRAMRLYFRKLFPAEMLGLRTKQIANLIADELKKLNPTISDDKAKEAVKKALITAKIIKDNKKKDQKTTDDQESDDEQELKVANTEIDALFFISVSQARAFAKLIFDGEENKEALTAALYDAPSIDIALFGRMVARDASLNYDASAQVAHSISTHGIHNEYDYFTAVDDCQKEDTAGARYLGTVEYNSSTLYRYATVNVSELAASVGADTPRAVRCFVEAFVRSMPTGMQNTFANRTLPDAIYVTVRTDQPVNLSGAFERPVKESPDGFVTESERRLVEYAKRIYNDYAGEPSEAYAVGDSMVSLAEPCSLPCLLDKLEATVRGRLSDRGEE